MSFVPKKQTYNARINEVVLGVGEKAVTIGGQKERWIQSTLCLDIQSVQERENPQIQNLLH